MDEDKKLFLLLSKLILGKSDYEGVADLVSVSTDWGMILKYAVQNKVIPLIYKNVNHLSLQKRIESHVYRILELYYQNSMKRNKEFNNEIERLNKLFYTNGIKAIILKGAILSVDLYKVEALREYGDADYLIKKEDLDKVTQILKGEAYVQGDFEEKVQIIPADRQSILTQKITTHELYKFVKLGNGQYRKKLAIDINHHVIWSAHKEKRFKINLDDFFDNSDLIDYYSSKVYKLEDGYQIIQLCLHLYSEAVYFCWFPNWVKIRNDLKLNKYIDILGIIDSRTIDWQRILNITHAYNIEEPVSFVFKTLNIIYPDSVPKDVMSTFHSIQNVQNIFYDKSGNLHYWKSDFLERFFNVKKRVKEILEAELELS